MDNNIAQENLNLPHDIVKLPSEGKFYKNNKKSVKVGYLTAVDENMLSSAANMDGQQIIINLVRSKMYEPDLRPEDMLEGDIEAILVFLRNTSFGSEYKFTSIDPETGKQFQTEISLDELVFRKPEVEPDSKGVFSVTLPKSGKNLKLKMLTFGELNELNRYNKTYIGSSYAPTVTNKLLRQIVEVDGSTEQSAIQDFVSKMPIMDSKFISKFISDNEPKLELNREVLAPSGKKVLVRVSFGAEFFRPFF